ncbi:hypothetical protein [Vibrio sp. NH-UV-68]|uniref:cadherin repeat domain-containing protein n=1 Tax=unclassified Vibrio TaxID=2614977 RepID=UPI0036F311FD
MNAKSLATLMLANTSVVIDVNGEIRALLPGEVPAPGEVVVTVGQDTTAEVGSTIDAQLFGNNVDGIGLDLDNEIASIIEQIEQGVDPTQNDEFATAAGGQNGSSPTNTGAIERTGAETLAQTQFDTAGLESQGLSETQSLAVLDLVTAQLISEVEAPQFDLDSYNFSYDENSLAGAVVGTVSATDLEGDSVTYSLVFEDGNPLADFFIIDPVSGEISLTSAGAAAYTNDFEDQGAINTHQLVVQASDGNNISQVLVTLNEQDVNEPPTFQPPEDEEQGYVFSYPENSPAYDENDVEGTRVASVSASDPEGVTISYRLDFAEGDPLADYFMIDDNGNIFLTEAGAEAFTNDYEDLNVLNEHGLTVVASDGVNDTSINVALRETDVNELPTFQPPEDEEQGYVFSYPENSPAYDENDVEGTRIASVSASDPEGVTISYRLDFAEGDPLADYFMIDDNGNIFLTEAGAEAFTNDYEDLNVLNEHGLTVVASDGVNDTSINVTLKEENVNELPVSEDFNIDAGNAVFVPIVFDSDDPALDHISDEDDDFNKVDLNVMITSLPTYGTLLYTDDFGESRVITTEDLHVVGQEIDAAKLFNPDNFTYVPGEGEPFEIGYSGDPETIIGSLDDDGFYNWGAYVSDTERLITLDNGNTIGVALLDNNDKELVQYLGGTPHTGFGIGDEDGQGLNMQETLVLNLSDNPLGVVTFGLDGLGGSFTTNSAVYVAVTYTLADGSTHIEHYQKDEGDVGNSETLYEFSYSSPDNPVVEMEMTSTGGNWVLSYLQGTQEITENDSFDYVAVDSDLAVSNESSVFIDVSDSPEYSVVSADDTGEVNAELGNQVMLGDEQDNVFVWLDDVIDNGSDVVDNFTLGEDLLDLRGILEEAESVDLEDLVGKIDSEIVDGDIVLTVIDNEVEQSIVLDGAASDPSFAVFIDNGTLNEMEMLTQILKTDTV